MKETKKFALIGFPRGATRYISLVAKKAGIDITHEKMDKDGCCDWRLILLISNRFNMNDKNIVFYDELEDIKNNKISPFPIKSTISFFKNKEYKKENINEILKKIVNIDYKYKLFFIRNPYHTISTWAQLYKFPYGGGSLALLNYYSKKYTFNEFSGPIHQAVAMYLEYSKLMIKLCDKVILVENIFKELNEFFKSKDLDYSLDEAEDFIELNKSEDFHRSHNRTKHYYNRYPISKIEENLPNDLFIEFRNFINKIYKGKEDLLEYNRYEFKNRNR